MDVDLWLRMAFRTKVQKLPVVLSSFRRHDAQRDTKVNEIHESYQRMILESSDIKAAPLRLRLAAAAGRRVFAQHYPIGGARRVRRDMWTAILLYPPVLRAIAKPELLLPTSLQSTRLAALLRRALR